MPEAEPSVPPLPADDPRVLASHRRHWRSNVRILVVLLLLWAAAGIGCGVLFADTLNAWHLGGFPLGFWFAQQGSIVVFVLLILTYALLMARLDRRHRRELDAIRRDAEAGR